MIYQAKVRRRLSRGGLLAIGLLALVVLPGWSHSRSVGQEAEIAGDEALSEIIVDPAVEGQPKDVPRPADLRPAQRLDLPTPVERVQIEVLPQISGDLAEPPGEAVQINALPPAPAKARTTEQILEPVRVIESPTPSIPSGYRVVTVPLDEASTRCEHILPGARVDVLWTPQKEKGAVETEQRTILEKIRVFAVEAEPASSHDERAVSLLVTPQQAEKLALADETGRIGLGQRPSTGPPPRPQPPQKMIEVFRLKNRDPAEMMEIVTALWRLVLIVSHEDFPAREVAVLAVVKTPVRGSGMYPGGPGMYGGAPMMSGGGMSDYEEGGYGMDMYEEDMGMGMMSGFSGQAPKTSDLPRLYLSIDRRTNALIARAHPELMELVRELVAALDTADDSLPAQLERLPDLRWVKFRHRKTEEMIRVLRELQINVQVARVPVREEEAALVQRGGTLIAAGGKADLDQIEQMIQALDVEGGRPSAAPGSYPGMMGTPSRR